MYATSAGKKKKKKGAKISWHYIEEQIKSQNHLDSLWKLGVGRFNLVKISARDYACKGILPACSAQVSSWLVDCLWPHSPFKKCGQITESREKKFEKHHLQQKWAGVFMQGESWLQGSKRDFLTVWKAMQEKASNQPSFSSYVKNSFFIPGPISVTIACFIVKKEAWNLI